MDVPACCPDTQSKAGLAVWLSSNISVAALYSIQQIPEIEGDVRECVRAWRKCAMVGYARIESGSVLSR